MIALRSLLLALLGSYAIASSTERKLRSVPVAATTIQVPPEHHLIQGHSGRRMQSCDALLATVQSCVLAFPSCGSCVDSAWDTLPETITCSVFEDTFCDAIYVDCNCGTCTDELEDWFECLALTGGCDAFGFDCGVPPPTPPTPTPPPPCDCAGGDNGGAGGICLRLIGSSECPADPNLSAGCTATEVAVGELCEADDNENGTDANADNCSGGYDVYERIPCDGLPSEECELSDFSTFCSNLGQNLVPACVPAI